MLTVISPAKRLNESAPAGESLPQFGAKSRALARIARALSVQDLCDLMEISPELGALNHARFAAFAKAKTHAAAHLFDGDTYGGLDYATLGPDARHWADQHLRILSGLYGVLRPMDAIAPYRLEMGSRLANPLGANLYAFWRAQIGKALRAQARQTGAAAVLNCASVEYFSAVDLRALQVPVIAPVFFEETDAGAKIISFWAKRARGAMARFVQEGHITDSRDLRGFDLGGYQFSPSQSTGTRMVFTRAAQTAAALAAK